MQGRSAAPGEPGGTAVLPAWDRREADSGVLAMGTGGSFLPPFHTASRS